MASAIRYEARCQGCAHQWSGQQDAGPVCCPQCRSGPITVSPLPVAQGQQPTRVRGWTVAGLVADFFTSW